MAPTLRPERPSDAADVRAVHVAAFPTPAEANLVDALRSAGHASVSLVAEADGKIVGHILFSPMSIAEHPAITDGLGLAPLAVLPALQRRGIGAALVREGLDSCRKLGAGFVAVLGDPAYYTRFGFALAHP